MFQLGKKKPHKVEVSSQRVSSARRLKFKKLLCKGIALGATSVIIGGVFLSAGSAILGTQVDRASADNSSGKTSTALQRSINQIKWASDKSGGSLSSKDAMTTAEWKTIGFFVSNYYTPFVTTLGSDAKPVGKKAKESMTNVLVKGVGLQEKPASEMAIQLLKLSSSNQEKLYLAKSNDGGKTWQALDKQASYFEVLYGSVGIISDDMLNADESMSFKKRYNYKGDKNNELLGLYSKKTASNKVIKRYQIDYEWNPSPTGKYTASQSIFYANFMAVDPSTTWGASTLTFPSNKKINSAIDSAHPAQELRKVLLKYPEKGGTIKEFYEHSIFSANLYVDVFGNLISSTGMTKDSERKVILPASQNPMYYAGKSQGVSDKADNEDKSKDESSSSSDKKSSDPDKKVKVDKDNGIMARYYLDDKYGVGRQVPINNLNTFALVKSKGILSENGGTAKFNSSSDIVVRPYFGSSRTAWDEVDGVDMGSTLKNLLLTQFAIRRLSPSKDWIKKYEYYFSLGGKKFDDSTEKKWFDGLDSNTSASEREDLRVKTSDVYNGKDDLYYINAGEWWQKVFKGILLHDVTNRPFGLSASDADSKHGAEDFPYTFMRLGAKAGSDDVDRFKGSITEEFSTIDSIVAFDKWNFGSPNFSDVSDTLKSGKMADAQAEINRIRGGKWIGVGTSGSLDQTFGDGADKVYGANIYVSTYLTRANPNNDKVNYVLNLEGTPELTEDDLTDAQQELSENGEDMDAVLKNMAYFLLNPTTGREYKQRLSKTFANQVGLSLLNDMVGSNTASSYAGSTRYLELTGFATVPRLDEIKFTDYLYKKFETWGIFFIVIASALMLIFVFIGQVRVLPAIVSVIAFGIIIYTPPKLLNSSINTSNALSSYMFKDKFLFWVMATHQNYEDSLSQLQEEAKAGNYNNYTALLVKLQGGAGYEETGGQTDIYEWQKSLGATVKLRWMSPKKDGYVAQVERDVNSAVSSESSKQSTNSLTKGITKVKSAKADESKKKESDTSESEIESRQDNATASDGAYKNGANSPLTSSIMSQGLSQQNFTGLDTNYLYRGYADISDYSRFYYGNIMGSNVSSNGSIPFNIGSYSDSLSKMFPSSVSTNNKVSSASDSVSASDQRKSMLDYLASASSSKESNQTLRQRAQLGFINDRKGDGKDGNIQQETMKRIFAPISSKTVSEQSQKDVSKVKVGDTVGLSQDYFILSTNNFNNHNQTLASQMADANKNSEDGNGSAVTLEDGDAASLSTFALYTESPFYYLSWGLYDNGLSVQNGSSGEFKKMMLEDNSSFFYNYQIKKGTSGYGALKDFMDFGSLFTTVIPYLREANKTLLQWDDIYGTKPFTGYGYHASDLKSISDKNSEAYYKTWFNKSADDAYRTYTAWVDYLYQLDIAKPEKISYGGKSETVSEPMNPASYHLRPMVFSESEMLYYGLRESDLTRVEKAILKTNKDIRNDMLNLMNYYTLDDTVLNTAGAMTATFDFNKNFSQTGFNQTQIVFEPQGFELKTFGWDAYLRMILQNATGESIAYNQKVKSDIYSIVAEKDGTMTLIMMIVQSFIVVYLIPAGIVMILYSLPIAVILSVMVGFIRRDRKFVKTFAKECVAPFLTVLVVNVVLSGIVSILMGNGGYDLVTGDLSETQSFSSPRSTLAFLTFVTLIAVAIYATVILNMYKGMWKNAKITAIPVKAGMEMTASLALGNINKLQTIADGAKDSVSNASSPSIRRGARTARNVASSTTSQTARNIGKTKDRLTGLGRSTFNKGRDAMSDMDARAKEAQRKLQEALAKDSDKPNASSDGSSSSNGGTPPKPTSLKDLID